MFVTGEPEAPEGPPGQFCEYLPTEPTPCECPELGCDCPPGGPSGGGPFGGGPFGGGPGGPFGGGPFGGGPFGGGPFGGGPFGGGPMGGGPGLAQMPARQGATSNAPVRFRDGAVIERAVDFVVPNPYFEFRVSRSYTTQNNSKKLARMGNRWGSNHTEFRFIKNDHYGSNVELVLSPGALIQVTESGSDPNFEYSVPADCPYRIEREEFASGQYQLVVTDENNDRVYIFYDLQSTTDEKLRGRLKEQTTRHLRESGRDGALYSYSPQGHLNSITTPEGQEYYIKFGYNYYAQVKSVDIFKSASNLTINGPGHLGSITYTYYQEVGPQNTWLGSDGDLVQVLVKSRDSGGLGWIEKVTQYRYYRPNETYYYHSNSFGFIKAVYEHEAVERIKAAGGLTNSQALQLKDCDVFDELPSEPRFSDFASRSFDYYRHDLGSDGEHDTLWGDGEDLHAAYGSSGEGELHNFDEIVEAPIAYEETIGAGCSGCGGGEQSIVRRYHYLNQGNGNSHIYYLNFGDWYKQNVNKVTLLVIEDTATASGTPLYRRIYGLNDYYRKLREVLIENPQAGNANATGLKCWCQSWKYIDHQVSGEEKKEHRVAEYRQPSAYDVDSNEDLQKFLCPYTDQSGPDWSNDNAVQRDADGVTYVYEYNDDGYQTGVRIRKGEDTQPCYYVSATDYGDGDDDGAGHDKELKNRIVATYEYPEKTQTRSSGLKTTYSYTFWDHDASPASKSDQQVQSVTATHPTVASSQNGPGVGFERIEEQWFDSVGRLRFAKDGEGYVAYYSYDPQTGQLAYVARDVDPNNLPASASNNANASLWVMPADADADGIPVSRNSSNPDPLELVTTFQYDSLGRLHLKTEPSGAKHYTAYEVHRNVLFPYWDSTNNRAKLPIQVMELNTADQTASTYSLAPSFAPTLNLTTGAPTGLSTTPAASYRRSYTEYGYDQVSGMLTHIDSYHAVPSQVPSDDTQFSAKFDRTLYFFDAEGHTVATAQSIGPDGQPDAARAQFTYMERDVQGRVTATKQWVSASADLTPGVMTTAGVGTDAASEPVLTETFYDETFYDETFYDGDAVGDGHVTSKRNYYTTTGDFLATFFHRDYRGFLRAVERKNGTTVVKPHRLMDVDWMGRTIAAAVYKTDIADFQSTVVDDEDYVRSVTPSSGDRINYVRTYYDDNGRVWRTDTLPADGTDVLRNDRYYDRRGLLVAAGDPYGASTEYAYDGAGRRYQERTVAQLNSTKYSSGLFDYVAPAPAPAYGVDAEGEMSGGDEGVIELSHTVYDQDGNAIESHTLEANHDDADGVDLTARDDFVRFSTYTWYDDTDRVTTVAEHGAGNGSGSGAGIWEYVALPSSITEPTGSLAAELVTKYGYDPDTGRQATVTDPKGFVTKTFHDEFGRRLFVVENWQSPYNPVAGSPSSSGDVNRTTGWEYDGLGNVTNLTAYNDGSQAQVTRYLYGNGVDGSRLTNAIYPDSSDTDSSGTDQVKTSYHLDGAVDTRTDQRGVVLTYSYDDARRPTLEAATTVPSSVYSGTLAIGRVYDTLGRLTTVTSHQTTSSSSFARNQIKYTYSTTHGKLTKTEQSHSGAVTTGTPSVQYAYDVNATGGVYTKGLRPTSMTYPNGRVLTNGYGSSSSRPDRLRRVEGLTWASTDVATYAYNGTGRLAEMAYVQPSTDVQKMRRGASAGEYPDYDRFGRQQLTDWRQGSTRLETVTRRFDYAGNPLSRDNDSAVYSTDHFDQVYDYDDLHRLTESDQGTYSAGVISASRQRRQVWTLEALGNWAGFDDDANGNGSYGDAGDQDQTRTHNAANELTAVSAAGGQANWADPVYDAAGNMTGIPKPNAPTTSFDVMYDPWNRPVYFVNENYFCFYDGLHRRVSSQFSGSVVTHYYYNEAWQLLEERRTTSGTAKKQFVWGPNYVDELVLRDRDANSASGDGVLEERLYALQDSLFNVTALLDTTGAVKQRFHYSAYGQSMVLSAAFVSGSDAYDWRHRYTGRELDVETGLQTNGNRYYHPALGRWITRDPVLYLGRDLNLYNYVAAGPTLYLDPNGLTIYGYLPHLGQFRYCIKTKNGSDYTGTSSEKLRDDLEDIQDKGDKICKCDIKGHNNEQGMDDNDQVPAFEFTDEEHENIRTDSKANDVWLGVLDEFSVVDLDGCNTACVARDASKILPGTWWGNKGMALGIPGTSTGLFGRPSAYRGGAGDPCGPPEEKPGKGYNKPKKCPIEAPSKKDPEKANNKP